jgi:long-chain acyl-CoA synthetase
MIHEEQEFTNHQFLDWGKRLHEGLMGLGVQKGDIISMCLSNHPKIQPIFQGIFRSGAVAAPVMFALTATEINFILSDTKAVGVVTDTNSIKKIREAVQGLEHVKWIAVLEGEDNPTADTPEYSIATLLESSPREILPYISEYDLAMILYTSGTTGRPKGVMLTHKNLYAGAEAGIEASGLANWKTQPHNVHVLPLAHVFGVTVMIMGLMLPDHLKGTYSVLLSWFDAEKFMELVQKYKIQRAVLVPTMIALLLNHPKTGDYDLTSLKEAVASSAPLPAEHARKFCELVQIDRVRNYYGCTENSAITATPRTGEYSLSSVGKPMLGVELAIFDQNDNPLPPGENGEIVMKGPTMMKGYLNRPEATAETLQHGWLHTGDVGYLDDDGFLYISDRKKDMIIRGGENIYPAELESVMHEHPSIAEAAVVGRPDPVYGENVVAFVVLKQGETATADEIIEFMKIKVTKFKVPSHIHFINQIPKSPVGKVLKRELKRIDAEATE